MIIINAQNEVSLIAGGAGGILIMTSLIGFLINYIYLDQSLEFSIKAKRLHHQLQPMSVLYETDYDEAIIKFLTSRGHIVVEDKGKVSGFASLVAIGVKNGQIDAQTDPRRGGAAKVFGYDMTFN
jgi:gamma-glutamyltranspeptidase/glutathione hydrolase